MRGGSLAVGFVVCLSTSACGPAGPGAGDARGGGEAAARTGLHFTDVTATSGIDLVLTTGRVPAGELVEANGTGVALIDFDGDGDLDVFTPNGATLDSPGRGPGCRLYENVSTPGTGPRFVDATARAGLDFAGWGMGVAVGDVDGDGHDDLFVACFGPNVLLRNRGDGTFEDVSAAAGLDGPAASRGWSTGCAFGDVDGDGDLDLYVCNYVEFDAVRPPKPAQFKGVPVFRGPMSLTALPDVLYLNDGSGAFTPADASWGLDAVTPSYGLGVVMLDLDDDGRLELFVGNDSEANFLLDDADPAAAGPGPRRLVDRAAMAGVGLSGTGVNQATMGIAVADVDDNGRPDLFSSNFSNDANTLHCNLDGCFYEDRSDLFGLGAVSRPFLGWSTMFFDFDHDADEDLVVFNGHIYPHASMATMDSEARQPPLLFERRGARFVRATAGAAGAWLDEAHDDRSAAFGDLDGDGDVDVVVGELSGPLRVLRNDRDGGGWLLVELRDGRDGSGNRRGLGSRVELRAGDAPVQRRWIFSGGGFQSASAAAAHFGLPADAGAVQLEVTWPDGTRQVVRDVAPGRRLVVTRTD